MRGFASIQLISSEKRLIMQSIESFNRHDDSRLKNLGKARVSTLYQFSLSKFWYSQWVTMKTWNHVKSANIIELKISRERDLWRIMRISIVRVRLADNIFLWKRQLRLTRNRFRVLVEHSSLIKEFNLTHYTIHCVIDGFFSSWRYLEHCYIADIPFWQNMFHFFNFKLHIKCERVSVARIFQHHFVFSSE